MTIIDRYLIDTLDRSMIYKMNQSKELECFIDANFASSWNANDPLNPEIVLLRTGFVIIYASILIY